MVPADSLAAGIGHTPIRLAECGGVSPGSGSGGIETERCSDGNPQILPEDLIVGSQVHEPTNRPDHYKKAVSVVSLGIRTRLAPMFSGDSIRSRAMRGSAWTVIGFGSGQILRLGANLILTRLLAPDAFGLMVLINVFLQCLTMLSDLGIDSAIIQNKHGDDPDFLCTAWTIGVIRGFLLWLAACAIAWPAAIFYDEPQLAWMIPVTGLVVLISGFQTTAIAQHGRHMKLERLTALQLTAQAINAFVIVFLAWRLRSVWALVVAGVLGAVVQTSLAHHMLNGIKHRISINRKYVAEIVRFGKWLFLATAMGYLAAQASDKLALGKLVNKNTLGIYSMAFMLAQLPSSIVTMLTGRILYPALSESSRQDDSQFADNLYRARATVWRFLLLMTAGLAFFGPLIFTTLWDPRYHAAGWMLQLMLASVWFTGLNSSLNAALLAKGDSFASAIQNTLLLIVGIPAMMLGFTFLALPGLILGIAAATACAHVALHMLLRRHGVNAFRQDFLPHLCMGILFILASLASGVTVRLFGLPTFSFGSVERGDPSAITLAILSLLGALAVCLRPQLRLSGVTLQS